MRRTLLVMLLLLVTAGCTRDQPAGPSPSGTPGPGTHEYGLRVGDRDRRYQVHVPASAAGKRDLAAVIVLHGGGGNGSQVAEQTHFSDVADRFGFLAVYPDGTGRTKLLTWNAGTCCAYARDQGVDDVGFVDALIGRLDAMGVERVFVTGFSNGAMLTYRLGCELAGKIDAIAPVSGALDVPTCTPSRPLPVYAIHGDADPVVPYAGGPSTESRIANEERAGSHRSVAYAMTFWARTDHCAAQPEHTGITTRYAGCASGTEVRLDTIPGGTHAWPGGTAGRRGADQPSTDLDASVAIWDFFATHSG